MKFEKSVNNISFYASFKNQYKNNFNINNPILKKYIHFQKKNISLNLNKKILLKINNIIRYNDILIIKEND